MRASKLQENMSQAWFLNYGLYASRPQNETNNQHPNQNNTPHDGTLPLAFHTFTKYLYLAENWRSTPDTTEERLALPAAIKSSCHAGARAGRQAGRQTGKSQSCMFITGKSAHIL